MKKQLLVVAIAVVLGLIAVPRSTSAQITGPIDLKVTFSFYVGNTELPAGSYTIRPLDDSDNTLMELRSTDKKTAVLVEVESTTAQSPATKSQVVFKKYGDREILSEIWEQGSSVGAVVSQSQHEKRAAKGGSAPSKHAVEVTSKKTAKS